MPLVSPQHRRVAIVLVVTFVALFAVLVTLFISCVPRDWSGGWEGP